MKQFFQILILQTCLSFVTIQAQTTTPADQLKIGDVTFNGWLRTRASVWDWFDGNANDQYAISETLFRFGFSQSKKSFDWKVEFAVPILLGLPDDAVAPGPQGQFGFGGSYYVNGQNRNSAFIFPKQAYGRFKFGSGRFKQSLLVGRNEFLDGMEVIPKNKTLALIKRDRIAQRLIGNFGFTNMGRSFDGGVYTLEDPRTNITLFAAKPTRGVFQVDGWGEVNIGIFYGAWTRQIGKGRSTGDLRVFGLGYTDRRTTVLKTDNRPQPVRAADTGTINIGSVGGHYIHALETKAGTLDMMFWGTLQGGSWGRLAHRAGAFAAEAGWQPPILPSLKPWLRGGYNYGSGDSDANDNSHGTFFQVLPTARLYARFPYFNMMNTRDVFGELVLRPSPKLTLRADIHSLALAARNDLWYLGGGVFQPWTFGFIGRPSNGQKGLGTLYDLSADYNLSSHVALTAYYAHTGGKLAIASLYQGPNANFGYVELNYRF